MYAVRSWFLGKKVAPSRSTLGPYAFIAEDNRDLLCIGSLFPTPNSFAFADFVEVNPKVSTYRRMRGMRELVFHLICQAKDDNCVAIIGLTSEDNKIAQKLYEKFGADRFEEKQILFSKNLKRGDL